MDKMNDDVISRALDERMRRLLRERMNPHFLFNALNTVHALINKDRRAADRAVILLADIYRFLIDHLTSALAPFEEEWRFMENYLALEELRFLDSLTVSMMREGDFTGIQVPPLILQPLVENALKRCGRAGDGTIAISAKTGAGRLRIAVRDNGPGPADSDEAFSRLLRGVVSRLGQYAADVDTAVTGGDEGVTAHISFRTDCSAPEKGRTNGR